ncbi:MAG: hypothetical protein ACREBB_04605 [Nitrosotalea sp.]
MSDEFLKVARQEIQSELDELERVVLHCNNDELIFKNSQSIESHFHKIVGLAPMIGQEKMGEMAKIIDNILKHIISKGPLSDSYPIISRTIEDMKKVFHGLNVYDVSEFRRYVRSKFPYILDL